VGTRMSEIKNIDVWELPKEKKFSVVFTDNHIAYSPSMGSFSSFNEAVLFGHKNCEKMGYLYFEAVKK